MNLGKPPATAVGGLPIATTNAQLISLLATMIQKPGQTPQQQQQLTEALTSMQINAALLAASQHPELMAQYQLALNNLAK